jgi:hypothetical protein
VEDGAVIDRRSGKRIEIPLASDIRFEIGIFAGLQDGAPSSSDQVASEEGWESLTLTLQRNRGANVVSKTVTEFTALTFATWNDDSAQHCIVDLTDSETNIEPGKYRLALTVQSEEFGPYPVGTSDIIVFDPHNLNSSDPADENPGAPISRDAADARYARIGAGEGSGLFNPDITSFDDLGALTTVAPPNPDAEEGDYITFDNTVAGDGISEGMLTVKLRAGTDDENLPFIKRPDDYDDQPDHLVWELRGS